MHNPEHITLSIIIPMHNEEKGIKTLFQHLEPILESLDVSYEIICVDDGSKDDTLDHLRAIQQHNKKIMIIELSRNFGKEAALTAGLKHANGDAIIPLDADLQDPPEMIEEMLKKWRAGWEVVYAVRRQRRHDPLWKQLTAKWFYQLFNRMSTHPLPENVGDFRLMDRHVVQSILALPERIRFNKGLFSWVGFKSSTVYYDRPARSLGSSAWSLWKLWNFALDGITAFSTFPLRVWTYIGLIISLSAFSYGSWIIVRTIALGRDTPGYASLICIVLFLGGVQIMSLGVIGEYIGRIFIEVKKRPIYIVRTINGKRTT